MSQWLGRILKFMVFRLPENIFSTQKIENGTFLVMPLGQTLPQAHIITPTLSRFTSSRKGKEKRKLGGPSDLSKVLPHPRLILDEDPFNFSCIFLILKTLALAFVKGGFILNLLCIY